MKDIEERIREKIIAHPRLNHRSLAVSDSGRVVTVVGAVGDREALHLVGRCVHSIAPARMLRNLATVSDSDVWKFSRAARSVERVLDEEVPEADIEVSCVGSAVVLRGEADPLEHERVEELAAATLAEIIGPRELRTDAIIVSMGATP